MTDTTSHKFKHIYPIYGNIFLNLRSTTLNTIFFYTFSVIFSILYGKNQYIKVAIPKHLYNIEYLYLIVQINLYCFHGKAIFMVKHIFVVSNSSFRSSWRIQHAINAILATSMRGAKELLLPEASFIWRT